MTSRERVQRCLTFQSPDRAPRELWALPWVSIYAADEYREVVERFPVDFGGAGGRYPASERARGAAFRKGTYTDEWGCVWEVAEDGVAGEIRVPILPALSDAEAYRAPWELVEGLDLSDVNAGCAASELFIRAGQCARPFERMQFLRGSQNLFVDLAEGSPEVYKLRDRVHEYYLKEMELWAETDVDAVNFMDDWGTQNTLLISPKLWREFYKPLYRDYCDLAHSQGKFIFFHSDGHIEAIYPDLVEIGVDAVNSQLFCMDIEKLGREFKGKITFWGEIDRQWILPFGTVEDVRAAVRRVRAALDDGTGGVIAECEWGVNNPKENILAVYEEWEG